MVFQFATEDLDFSALLKLEAAIHDYASTRQDFAVDGNDYGLGEGNIFIHTDDPQTHFEEVAAFIDTQQNGIPFAAGYRSFTENDYTLLWPASATCFVVA